MSRENRSAAIDRLATRIKREVYHESGAIKEELRGIKFQTDRIETIIEAILSLGKRIEELEKKVVASSAKQ